MAWQLTEEMNLAPISRRSGYTPWRMASLHCSVPQMIKPKAQKQLMKHKMLIGGTLLMLAALSAWGQDTATNNVSRGMTNNASLQYEQADVYRANELSLDGFGTGSLGSYTLDHPSNNRVRQNTEFGAGAGVNYFLTRNLGIGAEAYSENTTGVFIDNASGNLILRLPLGQSGFAPYAFGGGGHQFDGAKLWFGQAGAGLEYRFTRNVGVFLDARAVWPNETKYYGVARAGLRFAF